MLSTPAHTDRESRERERDREREREREKGVVWRRGAVKKRPCF